MKKYVLSAIAGVFVLASGFYFGAPSEFIESHASITEYDDVESIEGESDLIVVASPKKDFSDEEPTITYTDKGRIEDYYTVTDVEIHKIFKGEDIPETISVIQAAVMIKNDDLKYSKDTLAIEGYRVMEKDKEYLLFLEKKENDQYGILGVFQGKVNIDNSDKMERKMAVENDRYQKLKEEILEKYKSKLD